MPWKDVAAHKQTFHTALDREIRLAGRRIAKLALAIYAALGVVFFFGIVVLNWPNQPSWLLVFAMFLGTMLTVLVAGEVLIDYGKARVLNRTELRCPVCDLRRPRPETRRHVREIHPEIARGIRRLGAASWIAVALLLCLLYFIVAAVPLHLVDLAIEVFLVLLVPFLVFIAGALYWAGRRLPLEIVRARDTWKSGKTPARRP